MKRSLLVPVVLAVANPLLFVGREVCAQAPRRAAEIVATLAPDSSRARVSEFQTKGNLTLAGATILARTKLDVLKSEKNVYRFVATFPGNMTAGVTIRVTRGGLYTPESGLVATGSTGAAHNATIARSITGNAETLRLSYVLPAGAVRISSNRVPRQTLARLDSPRGAVLFRLQPVTYRGPLTGYIARRAAAIEGISVEMEVNLKSLGLKAAEKVVSEALHHEGVDIHPALHTAKAVSEVLEVLHESKEYLGLVRELNELQEAAEHPTNELTQRAYLDDPSLKQRILDEIAGVRLDMKLNQAVQYSNAMVQVGAGMFPLLAFAISPLTAANSRTLKELMEGQLRDLKKRVTTKSAQPPRVGPGSGTTGSGNSGSGNAGSGVPSTSTPGDSEELAPKPAPKVVEALYGCRPTDGLAYAYPPEDKLAPSPKGMWTAVYEGVQNEFSADGTLSHTTTETGTITFRVKPDGRLIDGTGTGKASFDRKDARSRTFGETAYTFAVSGFVNYGAACLVVAQGTQPRDFETVQTYFDPKIKPFYEDRGVPTDMLLSMTTWPALGGHPDGWPLGGALRLRHGVTHTWSANVTSKAGRRTTTLSSLTIQ